ncbi:glucosaminidase domain-containing protein [Pedobacter sp. SAFR-022]|uniref:glucosaminidase domain-containing protein n=1 Tax=Pedobacter sp. SAFR-022 TaxID=3436861 RepID=UPI003F7D35B0
MVKKFLFVLLSVGLLHFGAFAQTTRNYIEENLPLAQQLMRENNIPASIILGIAIHESAAGTSKIARYLNNHFGVKGQNNSKKIRSSYKGYSSVEDSYHHFIDFLQSRTAFSNLFAKYGGSDYASWAKGIQKGGYAHSKVWSAQVIALIKKYELFKYDNDPEASMRMLGPVAPLTKKLKPAPVRKVKLINEK